MRSCYSSNPQTSRQLAAVLICLGALLCSACGSAPAKEPAPSLDSASTRTIGSATVTGFVNAHGSHSWLGIPYAAPPVGPLRWQAPQPAASWQGDRHALAHGSPCIQFGSPLGGVGEPGSQQGSEDCLYLDVHAPKLPAAELANAKLPVLLWIHGGANVIGYSGFYSGAQLAARERVLVVMINYRLGPFGWFVLPGEAEGGGVAASGNWGTLDSIAALRWLQQHIGAFGGDPGNVTVIGESAGGTNVLALLLSPLAEGLFQRAIVQSGGLGFSSVAAAHNYVDDAAPGHATSSREILLNLLVSQGRAKDRAAARTLADSMPVSTSARFLRGLDPWTFYAAYSGSGLLGPRVPMVIQDGTVLRRGDALALFADPKGHIDVPTLLGTNRDEPKIFMAFDPANVRRLFGLPLWLKDGERYDREAQYGAMSWKLHGVDEIAARLGAAGAPAFAYRWDWDEEGTTLGFIDLSRILGAAHGLEIPFVFGHFDIGTQSKLLFDEANAEGRITLSNAMMSYWAEFAASGTPGRGHSGKLPEWRAWAAAAGGPRMMLLDTPAGGGVRMSNLEVTRTSLLRDMASEPLDDAGRCALFQRVFRWDDDPWTDTAWRTFNGGRCVAQPLREASRS